MYNSIDNMANVLFNYSYFELLPKTNIRKEYYTKKKKEYLIFNYYFLFILFFFIFTLFKY